jgi:transketolase
MADVPEIETLTIDTIRTLSMDAVQAANSGHPGTPMALAPVAYCLWQRFLRYDPGHPAWPNRDRFVLSAGHASMLVYSLLHLAQVRALGDDEEPLAELAVPLSELKRFRQLESRCPGHPEYGLTAGVETTTGPLGQGVAVSVGMAIASRWLAARYNRPGFELFGYDVYALASDGCLMEGISGEAASIAGHLRLSNLCWIYDNNRITIEGETELAFSEDVATRFRGYGWNVTHVSDANDLAALERGYRTFRETSDRPTLIVVDSHIGWGSPKQDSHKAHGEPLGEDAVRATKKAYGWPEDSSFLVPEQVPEHFAQGLGARGRQLREEWDAAFRAYSKQHPAEGLELKLMRRRELPEGWDADLPAFPADPRGLATRDSGGKVLNAIASRVPWLVGGSADLAPSTKTLLTFEGAGRQSAAEPGGRNFHFGIREHAMGAVVNGLTHCKLRGYGSTFLIFNDYMRTPVRLGALMELPTIFVYTHDSIGVGEDGPTHQPIEQLAAMRAIPGLIVLRPADANEVAESWRVIAELRKQPAVLVLTRQALPTLDRGRFASARGVRRGAYVLADPERGEPQVLLLATGSEVSLCVDAWELLAKEGVRARVVSMPSWELFEKQDRAYRESVLPPSIAARVSVEQAATLGWERYVGISGAAIRMRSFGGSAPSHDLQRHFGFTPEAIAAAAREQLAGNRP